MAVHRSRQTMSVSEDRVTEAHSLRRGEIPKSADVSLVNRNRYVLASDMSYREQFNQFFKPYIDAYNAKQKRRDRKWDYDYYQKLIDGGQVTPICSFVVQIGNNTSTCAITDVTFDVKEWRRLRDEVSVEAASAYVAAHLNTHPNVETCADILEELAKRIPEKFPCFVPTSACIHMDEPNSAPHMDCNGYFVAHKNQRGLDVRCAKEAALREMGYDGKAFGTPYADFQQDFLKLLEEVASEYGIEREIAGSTAKHKSVAMYRIEQEREDEANKLRELRRLNEIARLNTMTIEEQRKEAEKKLNDLEYEISVTDAKYREAYAQKIDTERELKSLKDRADAEEARIRLAESRVRDAQAREDDARRAYRRVEDDTAHAQKKLDDINRQVQEAESKLKELTDWAKKLSDIRQTILLFMKALIAYLNHETKDHRLSVTDRQSAVIAKNILDKLQNDFITASSNVLKKRLEQLMSGYRLYDDVEAKQNKATPISQETKPVSSEGSQEWWDNYSPEFFSGTSMS